MGEADALARSGPVGHLGQRAAAESLDALAAAIGPGSCWALFAEGNAAMVRRLPTVFARDRAWLRDRAAAWRAWAVSPYAGSAAPLAIAAAAALEAFAAEGPAR
jgi:hypothetical protein